MAKRRWKISDIKAVVNNENPFVQVGYEPKRKRRKIGDEWTDSKGTWKKTKNGIISVNKQMDSIRELVRPRCSVCQMDINLFGDRIDKKLHLKTGKCWKCLTLEETAMKIDGTYEKYEETKILKNRLSMLREFRKNVIETIDYLKKGEPKIEMVCSNGNIVSWSGQDIEPILKDAQEDLIKSEVEIKRVEEEVSKLKTPVSV